MNEGRTNDERMTNEGSLPVPASRGGEMVILNPIPNVQHVLEVTGIPAIIPIYSSFESAETILTVP